MRLSRNALSEHILRYNQEFRDDPDTPALTIADLHGRWIWDAVPAHRVAALERYMLSDDFFAVLGVMPDAQRVLDRLQSSLQRLHRHRGYGSPYQLHRKIQLARSSLPLHPVLAHRLLRRQRHPSRPTISSMTIRANSSVSKPGPLITRRLRAREFFTPRQRTSTSRASIGCRTGWK